MNKLKLSNITKRYHQEIVLKDVSLEAARGDIIALLGSSGSGKSTLLRCVNLLTIPDSGTVQVDEQLFNFTDTKGLKSHSINSVEIVKLRKKVGMVFQQFNLWEHMTVLQNLIEAPIQVLKQQKQIAIEEAMHFLNKVGLANQKDKYPAQLSGGQQQRAAIARALMMKPEIMLFDEPTSALDPEKVGEVLNVMQQLANEGMTMLIATHELSFAKKVANYTIFLEKGIIFEQGETQAMFNAPKTERFKQFLSSVTH